MIGIGMLKNKNLDKIAVLFSVFIFLVYISTLSISLDDEDSVHFALGLTDFNVTKYQPHPPGFPVYIALGAIFNAILNNEILALTFMSAFFGALSVFVFYSLAKEMFGKEVALCSSVLMAFTPLFWLNSVKAMSDMTGLFFVLVPMFFIHRYIKYKKPLDFYLGAFIAGISAGIRIHSLLMLLPLLLYGTYKQKQKLEVNLKGGLFFVIAILLWFIPLILITGIPEYLSAAGGQLTYRVDRPYISMLGFDLTYENVIQRLIGFPYFFLLGGYGINLASLGVLSVFLLFLVIALGILFLKKIDLRDERFVFFSLGVLPYLIAVFIMLPPFNPRYLLILVPLLSLVFTNVVFNLKKTDLRYVLFAFLIVLVLVHSVFLALQIRSIPSPPVQLIGYINENYGPEDVIILNGFAGKYFTYYEAGISRLSSETDCETIRDLISRDKNVLTISGSESCEGLELFKIISFSRDPRVHVKRSMISLYEFSFTE